MKKLPITVSAFGAAILRHLKPLFLAVSVVTALLLALPERASAQAIYYDFNTPGQLTNNFGARNKAGNQGVVWTQITTNGVSNSGSLDNARTATDDNTLTYLGDPLLLPLGVDATLNISVLFKGKATPATANPIIQLGFMSWTNAGAPPTNSYMEGNSLANWLNLRLAIASANTNMFFEHGVYITTNAGAAFGYTNKYSPATNAVVNAAAAFTNWYKLSATFIRRADSTSFTVSGSLQDMGPDGTTPGAILIAQPATNYTHVNGSGLGNVVYPALRAIEGNGVDAIDNLAAWMTNGAPVIVSAPANQTISTYRSATFKTLVDGTPPFTYTWYTNGIAVPGVTGSTYTSPVFTAADGMVVGVEVANGSGTANNFGSEAVLTVNADAANPNVVSVGSLDGRKIGVVFSEAVNPAQAANKDNYTITPSGTISSAVLRPDGQSVELTLAAPISGGFTVTVANVTDLAGNPLATATQSSTVLGLTQVDIGAPLTPGSVFSLNTGDFDITAGGVEMAGQADQGNFAYAARTGDFDLKVRVQNLVRNQARIWNIFTGRDETAAAGLMVRETLSPGSRMYFERAYPADFGMPAGSKNIAFIQRTAAFAASSTVAGDFATPANGGLFPNTWLRVRRINNTFTFYTSTDGLLWTQRAQGTQTLPDLLYTGLGTTAHYDDFNYPVTAQYRNFGEYSTAGAALAFLADLAASTVINPNVSPYTAPTLSLSVTVTNTGVSFLNNEVQFIWQRGDGLGGFTNLPTVSAAPTTTPNTNAATSTLSTTIFSADNGAQFRVIAKAPGSLSVTSVVSTLTISGLDQPTITAAYIPWAGGNIIDVTFSVPLDPTTATNVSNYQVRNSLGQIINLTSVQFQPGAFNAVGVTRVLLTTAQTLPFGMTYTVATVGLKGANGLDAAATPVAFNPGTVKVELWFNTGSGGDITGLTSNAKYLAGMGDIQYFTNNFSFGASAGGFNNNLDSYGGRLSAFFQPPSNGVYRFYIRNDDGAMLFINTNGNIPAGKVMVATQGVANASYGSSVGVNMTAPITMTQGVLYYIEAIWKEGSGNDGFALAFREQADASTPPTSEVASGQYFLPVVEPSYPVRVELYYGNGTGTAVANTTNNSKFIDGLPDVVLYTNQFGYFVTIASSGQDNYGAKVSAYFLAPSNGFYRFYVRSDDASQLFMNTNAVNSTDPAGKTTIAREDSCCHNYNAGTGALNPGQTAASESAPLLLNSNQLYYLEGVFKEGGGGDGITVAFRGYGTYLDSTNTTRIIPPTTETIPGNFFRSIPPPSQPNTTFPTLVEVFTGMGGVTIADMTSTQKYLAGTPDISLRYNVFGFNIANNNFGLDNYGARVKAYFVPPSTAYYRFYIRSDDASQLWMNTNAVNSIDPAGKTIVAREDSCCHAYNLGTGPLGPGQTVASESAPLLLTSGQKYYMEALFKEGGGADYIVVAQRSYADLASATSGSRPIPVNAEVITNSFLSPVPGTLSAPIWTQPASLLAEIYTGITSGSAVANLQSDPRYLAGMPNALRNMPYFGWNKDLASSPSQYGGDNYGVRIAAYFVAPVSGFYRFYVRGDDQVTLNMNTNGVADLSIKPTMASITAFNASYVIGTSAESPVISLTNGQRYYLEGLMKEGSGGDGFSVAFKYYLSNADATAAGRTAPAATDVIPATYFVPITGAPNIATISGNSTVVIGQTVTITVSGITGAQPIGIQWRRNGVPILGAGGTSYAYTVTPADAALGIVTISAVPFNAWGAGVERGANLLLNVDALTMSSVVGNGELNEVTVTFSKAVSPDTATNLANYSIPGLTITGAYLKSANAVALLTSLQTSGTRYTLTANNIRDYAVGSIILPNSTFDFTAWRYQRGLVTVDLFTGINGGTMVQHLTGEPKFIYNSPDSTFYTNLFGYNIGLGDTANSYGGRVYGWFIAPSNGLYRFFIRSDDQSLLFMNTNAVNSTDPNGKVPIAGSTLACCGAYNDLSKGPVMSPYIALTGGQLYYLEALFKEGSGGDGVSVAFREINNQTIPPNSEAIPGFYFASLGNPDVVGALYLTAQPQNAGTIQAGSSATFSVGAVVAPATLLIAYQWQIYDAGSSQWRDVLAPAATLTNFVNTFNLPGTYQIRALVSAPGNVLTSQVATVTVTVPEPTAVPPALVWASANTNRITVTARFSEAVTASSANTLANYTLVDNFSTVIGISSAVLQGDGSTVVLTASTPLTANNLTNYTLTAANLVDVDQGLTGGGSYTFYVPSGNWRWDMYNGTTTAIPRPFSFWIPNTNNLISNYAWFSTGAAAPYNYVAANTENYLARMYGYFIPPSNGVYRFFLASDDGSELWMNTNSVNMHSPTGKTLLLTVPAANLGYGNVAATGPWIALNAGQRYYVEALLREGTGGDYIAVAVREYADQSIPTYVAPTGGGLEFISAGSMSAPEGLLIMPTNVTAFTDGASATLGTVVGVPAWIQWYTNNVAVAGATNPTFTMSPITTAYDGITVQVVATNSVTSFASNQFTLAVSGDSTPPTITTTYRDQTFTNLLVVFSEILATSSANNPANYTVTPGPIPVTIATLLPDGRTVRLSFTNALDPATTYTVAIANIADRATTPNVVAANTQSTAAPMTFTTGFLAVDLYFGPTTVATLTNNANFINNTPDLRTTIGSFDFHTAPLLPISGTANYGAKIYGWFVPPPVPSGQYKFFFRADDGANLYINTTGTSPLGKTLVASVGCCGVLASNTTPITLTPGQPYYIEVLYFQGGSQEYFTLDFRDFNSPPPPAPNNSTTVGYSGWAAGHYRGAEVASGAFFGVYGDANQPMSLAWVQQPIASTNIAIGQQVTLNALAVPTPATNYVFHQWQADDGAGGWTNVGPAITNFINDYAMVGNRSNYTETFYYTTTLRVVAKTPGGSQIISSPVTVNVTNTFDLLSMGSIGGSKIVLVFNQPVDLATATAPQNYSVNDDFVMVLDAQVGPDGRTVTLLTDVPVSGSFKVVITAVNSRLDYTQLIYNEYTRQVMPADYNNDLGANPGVTDPLLRGSAIPYGTGLDVVSGGSDIFNANDGCYFVARYVTGDFDIKVRVNALTNLWRGYTDANAKAGLMARVSANANSRMINFCVAPPALPSWPVAGANVWFFQNRDFTGAGLPAAVQGANAWSAPGVTPWLRLVRRGATFYGYRSYDGVNWTYVYSRDTALNGGAYPDTILVGMATTSHNNLTNAPSVPNVQPGLITAQYRDLYFPSPASISAQPPATVAVPIGQTLNISVTGEAAPNSGALTYQWRKDGINIVGATASTLSIPNMQAVNAGVYTIVVSDDGGGVVSTPTVVTVVNQPPSVTGESFAINQNGAIATNIAYLLGNDSDPEGRPISLFGVSGVMPATFSANFEDTLLPVGTTIYGNAHVTNNGTAIHALALTDAVGSQTGAWLINDLVPGRSVSAFIANFKVRIGDGSGNPADGFSFNVANDLPSAASGSAEEGIGTGFSFCIDNFNNANNEAPALDIKWKGIFIAHYPIIKINNPNWIPVSIAVKADGTMDLYFNNAPVVLGLQTGYTPILAARFGFYARTGGEFAAHWVDDINLTVLTPETSLTSSKSTSLAADFNAGLPASAKIYGNAYLTNKPSTSDTYVRLNDGIGGQMGSLVFDEVTPFIPVGAFTANFTLRVFEGSGQQADGFSFNFANDLPNGTSATAEDGVGSGLSICVDNYPAASAALKVRWKNAIVLTQPWAVFNADAFIQFTVTVTNGLLTVATNGVPVLNNYAVGYTPMRGRFGFYGRTGGEFESHSVDDINVQVYTYNTFSYYSDFNYFLPDSAKLYGSAYFTNSSGVNNSGNVHLTDSTTLQSGALVIDEITPFKPVSSFNATFKMRVGDGSGEPADGFSFNFAPDLPNGVAPGSAEEGVGSGFSFCFDNYRGVGGAPNTAAIKLKWKGAEFASVAVPVQNSSIYVPVIVSMNANGQVTVTVDGVVRWNNLATPYTPIRGRFGFFARTGGEYVSQWLDDLYIALPDSGYVQVVGTNITYAPPQNITGNDAFYYVVGDGQGGYSVATASVIVTDLTPPMILDVPHNPISISNDCLARIPDFNDVSVRISQGLVVTDTVSQVTVVQSPVAGTLVPMGTTPIDITVTDGSGNSSNRTFNLVVADLLPPVISSWPADRVNTNCDYTLADFVSEVVATDCNGPIVITQSPAPGTLFGGGTNRVTFYAVDAFNNTSTVQTVIFIPNASPVASNDTAGVKTDTPAVLNSLKLMGNDFHPDGREIFISAVTASTNGAPVVLAGDRLTVTYTPNPGFTGQDTFQYTLSDPCGRTATATVVLIVSNAGIGYNRLSLVYTNGTAELRYYGIPGRQYSLQRSPTLTPPAWSTLFNKVADPNGEILFVDPSPPNTNSFYRTVNESP